MAPRHVLCYAKHPHSGHAPDRLAGLSSRLAHAELIFEVTPCSAADIGDTRMLTEQLCVMCRG